MWMLRCCSCPRVIKVLTNSWADDAHDVLLGSSVVDVDSDPASYWMKTYLNVMYAQEPLTYNTTGLLDRPQKPWSQDGGNMRVFAHEVTC